MSSAHENSSRDRQPARIDSSTGCSFVGIQMKQQRLWRGAIASVVIAGLSVACCAQSAAPLPLSALLSPLSSFPLPAPPATFLCDNPGFARVSIPHSFVLDGVCDCCDGGDERVLGRNPWFTPKKKEQEGGWLSSLLASDTNDDTVETSPCPNTCSAKAVEFLADFSQKVASYTAAVDRKTEMLKGVTAVNQRISAEGKEASETLQMVVKMYRELKTELDAVGAQSAPMELQQQMQRVVDAANHWQFTMEHAQWLLGHTVPHPRNRQMSRPPGNFGQQREWLLLLDRCFEYAWPQRRFGSYGEMTDWYLMQLCPLHNATQVALLEPPPREGARWREPLAEGEVVAIPLGQAVAQAEKEKARKAKEATQALIEADPAAAQFTIDTTDAAEQAQPPEPPPVYVLGYWGGELLSSTAVEEAKTAKAEADALASAAAAAAAATAGASTTAAASATPVKKAKKPYKASSTLPPAGSLLNTNAPPSFHIPLRGGQECWNVGPRQVDVTVRCGEREELVEVREDGKCKYAMVLQTPLGCDKAYLAGLKQQLADHQKWFARPAPKPTKAKTPKQLHDEL